MPMTSTKSPLVAITDDDPDDRDLLATAFGEAGIEHQLVLLEGGADLLAYLRRARNGTDGATLPALLLIDLNMPGIDGHQALREIRADPLLAHIPVVILSTSRSATDCLRSHQRGANAFVSKPSGYHALVDAARGLLRFWLEVARLPAP